MKDAFQEALSEDEIKTLLAEAKPPKKMIEPKEYKSDLNVVMEESSEHVPPKEDSSRKDENQSMIISNLDDYRAIV